MSRLALLILCALFGGCVSVPRYPVAWAPIVPGELNCSGIDGVYDANGAMAESGSFPGPAQDPVLNSILRVGLSGPADQVAFNTTEPGVLVVTAIYLSRNLREYRIFRAARGDFECEAGTITFPLSSSFEVLAPLPVAGGNRSSLVLATAADGALIGEHRAWSGGVIVVAPLATYERTWYRFARVSAAAEAPLETKQP